MKKSKITVLFDAGPLVYGERSGVGQYTYRLIDALAKNYPDDIDLIGHYFNFLGRKHPNLPTHPNIKYKASKIIPGKVLSLTRRLGFQLPFDLFIRAKGDIVFFPNFVSLPLLQKAKVVIVIHDLSYIHHKQFLQTPNQIFLEKFVPRSIKSSDRVIAISENTKREIINHYKITGGRLSIINPAVDNNVFKPAGQSEIAKIKKLYGIDKPYILSVATQEPRKNLVGVLQAFAELPEQTKQHYSLVLAGGKGWLDKELQSKYDELASRYDVIRTGYIDDKDLPALYSGSSLFLFPSFYEGFGIPPLEAMACGVPVITSDNSSLPEVVGEAAITIDANDTQSLAKQIERVLSDKDLASSLSGRGLKRAKQFSWDDSARNLFELFKSLS